MNTIMIVVAVIVYLGIGYVLGVYGLWLMKRTNSLRDLKDINSTGLEIACFLFWPDWTARIYDPECPFNTQGISMGIDSTEPALYLAWMVFFGFPVKVLTLTLALLSLAFSSLSIALKKIGGIILPHSLRSHGK